MKKCLTVKFWTRSFIRIGQYLNHGVSFGSESRFFLGLHSGERYTTIFLISQKGFLMHEMSFHLKIVNLCIPDEYVGEIRIPKHGISCYSIVRVVMSP